MISDFVIYVVHYLSNSHIVLHGIEHSINVLRAGWWGRGAVALLNSLDQGWLVRHIKGNTLVLSLCKLSRLFYYSSRGIGGRESELTGATMDIFILQDKLFITIMVCLNCILG